MNKQSVHKLREVAYQRQINLYATIIHASFASSYKLIVLIAILQKMEMNMICLLEYRHAVFQ